MGNCGQCVGRDCGFKYQKYYGKNKEELDEYLRDKIKAKYEFRCSSKNDFPEISEKSQEYEEDSFFYDEKHTNNMISQANLQTSSSKNNISNEKIGERCETEIIHRNLNNLEEFKEKHQLYKIVIKEIPKEDHINEDEIPEINEEVQNTNSMMTQTAQFFETKKNLMSTPSPNISPGKDSQILSKTPTESQKFEFQNKIFDFKEIQSPNVLFKEYGDIFNDDDFSETCDNEKDEKEIEEKFPSLMLKRKTQK